MREIPVSILKDTIREMCIEANHVLPGGQVRALSEAREQEISPVGVQILSDMHKNLQVAGDSPLPICQDTGMAVVFLDIGQDVHFTEGDLTEAVNEGVREGYAMLRKSVIADPIRRVNTGDNTPAILHTKIVPGETVLVKVLPKGFGSENTSQMKMLKPADGETGIEDFLVDAILKGAPNACAPVFAGVGIGGDFESCALLSKEALTIPHGVRHQDPLYADLEKRIMDRVNDSGIGPMGLGGIETILDVHILTAPTHIAGLPVAVNICCWVDRLSERVI